MDKEQYEIDTKLLDEAYKNVRMATFAIDCIIEKIKDSSLEKLLRKQNMYYLDMVEELEKLSKSLNHTPKDINMFLKGSSFTSIKMKTMINDDSSKIAQMLVEGTTMGITYTIQAKNDYKTKNSDLDKLVDSIISNEEEFVNSLKDFL